MSLILPPTAGFATIGLDGLNRKAALLDRAETKYVVDTGVLGLALGQLRQNFDVLAINGRQLFTYDTVYFDSDDLLCYRQHAQGRRRRLKVRSRRYVDSDLCYLEVKMKGRRGRTLKQRMKYSLSSHGELDDEARGFVRRSVESTYDEPFDIELAPALGMAYHRLTLVGKFQPERVTIDMGMRFRDPFGTATEAPSSTVIVEVKSPDGHGVADAVFHRLGIRGESCSKYCVGLNLVGEGLIYNTFNRTLRTHFDWTGPAQP